MQALLLRMDRRTGLSLDQSLHSLLQLVQDVSEIGDYVRSYRKECTNVVRRAKVLAPLFEELRDSAAPLPLAALSSLRSLEATLSRSKLLLEECRDGSQFLLVRRRRP